MTQTSKIAIDKASTSTTTTDSPVIEVSSKPACLSTKEAFKDCLSVNAHSLFYKEIPDIFLLTQDSI